MLQGLGDEMHTGKDQQTHMHSVQTIHTYIKYFSSTKGMWTSCHTQFGHDPVWIFLW